MGVAHSSERTPAHEPASKPTKVGSSSGPEAVTGVPSRRQSSAARQDGRAGNDDHQSDQEEGEDSAEDEDRKEERRQGFGEAARRMLRGVV